MNEFEKFREKLRKSNSNGVATIQTQKPLSALDKMLLLQKQIIESSEQEIPLLEPLITIDGTSTAIIHEGTMGNVQGSYGSHKSRIIGHLISILIAKSKISLAGFTRNNAHRQHYVVLIDTERAKRTRLPEAIKRIRRDAGYDSGETIPYFGVTSLKHFPRNERKSAVLSWIDYHKTKALEAGMKLVVMLDIVSDMVQSFNDDKESMELMDFLGELSDPLMMNERTATVFMAIHTNRKGTGESLGHLGAELDRKVSLKILMEVNDKNTSEVILKFKKMSEGKTPGDIILNFDTGQLLPDYEKSKRQGLKEEFLEILPHALPIGNQMKFTDIVKKIRSITKDTEDEMSESTAKKELSELKNRQAKGVIPKFLISGKSYAIRHDEKTKLYSWIEFGS